VVNPKKGKSVDGQ